MAVEITSRVSLEPFNSLALPGLAEFFCRAASLAELREALAFARSRSLPVTLLGGGSNTVVGGDVPGLVVALATKGIEVVSTLNSRVIIRVAAGENWHQLVRFTLDKGWYGLENLALIPGSVGAAPIQNIGAYGVELESVLESVEVMDMTDGNLRQLSRADCQLGYRDSIFKHSLKGRVVITSVNLVLTTKAQPNLSYGELKEALAAFAKPSPQQVFDLVCALRKAKLPDPDVIHNAGSFFKNPLLSAAKAGALMERFPDIPRYPQADGTVKFPAAWFIDRAGWKGRREAHVGVHQHQALVLIHLGGGCGRELLDFAARIARDVKTKFAVELEMEPVVIGSV
ncbi:MAG: UDP-N-acetylmuramate dehydrogenase [Porticoccaceae bacterium]|nr:UDP-N-acetylmuramate dehydrogenase [Porticoccaceae bacterium]